MSMTSLNTSDTAPASSSSSSLLAVSATNVCRSFGKTSILKRVNLTLPQGKIYGLLGPSGCGKTTLLKCILGRLFIDQGELNVLGEIPGAPNSNVPGPQVGFMPQELALYDEFTIENNLRLFAKMYNLNDHQLFHQRLHFLVDFLTLPDPSRRVATLSGGQKRRVSLACALLQAPRLLLLDEPTVGVDPTLRTRIWRYLRSLVSDQSRPCSIIVTTHYIEEARHADLVGFMRDGQILVQGSPDTLMQQFHEPTLEQTFLKICLAHKQQPQPLQQEDSDHEEDDRLTDIAFDEENVRNINSSRSNAAATAVQLNEPLLPPSASIQPSTSSFSIWARIKSGLPRFPQTLANVWKSFTRLRSSPASLAFQFLLPSVQVILFCLAIGKDPQHLHFGVVQGDGNPSLLPPALHFNRTLGQEFVDFLDQGSDFDIAYYNTADDAYQQVQRGSIWGYVVIPANYTVNAIQRIIDVSQGNFNDDPSNSTIYYRLDMTEQQIAVFVTGRVIRAFGDMLQAHFPATRSSLPLQSLPAVYGSESPSFTDFIGPGVIVTIAFAQSIGLSAIAFVLDEKNGNLDRLYAAGIRSSELMLSLCISQLGILILQVALLLTFAVAVFHLPMQGSIVLVFLLVIFLGLTGMMYGLVIAAICKEERDAMQLALGSFFPTMLLSGVIWPVEAIPIPLNYISLILPTTHGADAVRSVMTRGWGIEHPQVYQSFLITLAWITLMFLGAMRGLKAQK